ncbi:chondroitin proteoglycan 2-like [Limulus polyphemus]|uniref:Chondroitin proteoglycan 2-like n=1 Tax=Limulus polyphemus TaxID=6850 RepID=A0ABM1BF83_LIMPO|nr:chondroitin proteoglycan 2-like [Limulus polyphemus]
MASFFVFSVVVLFVSLAANVENYQNYGCGKYSPCLTDGPNVNPYSCCSFYNCHKCFATLENCPKNLHFNPHLKVCDWPSRASCRSVDKECHLWN